MSKGTPEYLLALIEYNQQLDELEEKYGSGIFKDPNAEIREINRTALQQAKLQEVQFANAYNKVLENNTRLYKLNATADTVQQIANNQIAYSNKEENGNTKFTL